MGTILKAVLNLPWPCLVLFFLQLFFICCSVVTLKKALKWWIALPNHYTKQFKERNEIWIRNKKQERHGISSRNKNKQREIQQDEIKQTKSLTFFKSLLKMYSIAQVCCVNLSINKPYISLLVQFWSWILLQNQFFGIGTIYYSTTISLNAICRGCLLLGWNGIALVILDILMQILSIQKLVENVGEKQQMSQHKCYDKKILIALKLYNGIMCILCCTFSLLTIRKIILIKSGLVFVSPNIFINFLIVAFTLIFVHHIFLLLLGILLQTFVHLLPTRHTFTIWSWIYFISVFENQSIVLNKIKPTTQESLHTLNIRADRLSSQIHLQQKIAQFEQIQNDATKYKPVPFYSEMKMHSRFKNKKKSKRKISINTSESFTNMFEAEYKQRSSNNSTIFRKQSTSSKMNTKYTFDSKNYIRQAEIELKQEKSPHLQFQYTQNINNQPLSFLSTQISDSNEKCIHKYRQIKPQSISQPILANIENKIKVTSHLFKHPKPNQKLKISNCFDNENEIEILDLSGYIIKDLGLAKSASNQNSRIKFDDSKMVTKYFPKTQKREINTQNGRKLPRRRYEFKSNPSIPEVEQNGHTFCLDDLPCKK